VGDSGVFSTCLLFTCKYIINHIIYPEQRLPVQAQVPGVAAMPSNWDHAAWRTIRNSLPLFLLIIFSAAGCGVTGENSPPPPPPPPISVSVSPPNATVFLGGTQQFSATVANTSNTTVTWNVNGIAGGNSTVGTITPAGLYTAPQNLPAQTSATVGAVSQADATKTASALVTISSDVTVSVSPATADVELGATRQFTATVAGSGNPNRAVNWSVSSAGCSGADCGLIDANGNFVAPQILPSPPTITVTARSIADAAKSFAATARVTSNFTLAVMGPDTVDNGATAQFAALLTPAPNSNPSPSVTWSVSGPGCTGNGCGTISNSGSFTAPQFAPNPTSVVIRATPVADPSRAATKTVTIIDFISVTIAPTSASVELGQSLPFSATVTGAQNITVTWDVNGIIGGNLIVGTITNPVNNPNNSTFTAPTIKPTPNQVTVRARSNANPNISASATVSLFSTIGVQVSPAASTRAVNHRQAFTVQITRTSNESVEWQVEGIAGGNDTLGRICVAGVQPCQPISVTQTSGATVDYLAPPVVPATNPVRVMALSRADPDRSGTSLVTILPVVLVSVQPASVTLPAGGTQQFTAIVAGTADQGVTWGIGGAGCGGAGAPCGSITPAGLYTAPLAPPTPNSLTVRATSTEDTGQFGTASVTIATGALIARLLPASITAGATNDVTLRVIGSSFVASSPGPGSAILVDGTARISTCPSDAECTTTLTAADLASAGNRTVQIRNPDQTLSNQVMLVVVPHVTTEDVILLSAGTPAATGKDLVVVEPSTAGISTPQADVDLNLIAVGLFQPATSTCVVSTAPALLRRPASGTATVDLCAFSQSPLDTGSSFSLTGPAPNDILLVRVEIIATNFVLMTLQLSSTTQKGLRTLFIENANRDKTAATGALEVR